MKRYAVYGAEYISATVVQLTFIKVFETLEEARQFRESQGEPDPDKERILIWGASCGYSPMSLITENTF